MNSFLIFLLAAMVGQVMHWIVGASDRNLIITYGRYMASHKWHTFSAMCSIFASIVGMYATGSVDLTMQNAAMAFMVGYTLDSLINKFPRV
jgi:hypothetical protein